MQGEHVEAGEQQPGCKYHCVMVAPGSLGHILSARPQDLALGLISREQAAVSVATRRGALPFHCSILKLHFCSPWPPAPTFPIAHWLPRSPKPRLTLGFVMGMVSKALWADTDLARSYPVATAESQGDKALLFDLYRSQHPAPEVWAAANQRWSTGLGHLVGKLMSARAK